MHTGNRERLGYLKVRCGFMPISQPLKRLRQDDCRIPGKLGLKSEIVKNKAKQNTQ